MPAAAYALQDTNNNRIREIDLKSGETTTLASTGIQGFNDGVSTSAQFSKPMGIAIDPQGAFALVGVCLSPIPASRASASHTRPTHPHRIPLRLVTTPPLCASPACSLLSVPAARPQSSELILAYTRQTDQARALCT